MRPVPFRAEAGSWFVGAVQSWGRRHLHVHAISQQVSRPQLQSERLPRSCESADNVQTTRPKLAGQVTKVSSSLLLRDRFVCVAASREFRLRFA